MLKTLIAKLFGHVPQTEKLPYEHARQALETQAREARRVLAARADVEPEILYYLASDDALEVRMLVAANPAAPHQADQKLAADPATEVRCELARKIARLVPGLDPAESGKLREMTIRVMETLAKDMAPAVRAILAEELKASGRAPPHIVRWLANDALDDVAMPVLEFSPLLCDADLLEIIAGARAQGALTAIARRNLLASPVADAIVETFDVPAVQALLLNGGARLRQETLERIAERAAEHVAWRRPIVMRPGLSMRAIRRLAEFVSANLLEALERQASLDPATKSFLRKRMKDRLAGDSLALDKVKDEARAAAQIRDAAMRGALDADYVMELVEQGARTALIQVLAAKAQVHPAIVEKILSSRGGKAITALVWRAGYGARMALKVQTLVAHVPGPQTVLPRDGEHFAMSPDDMRWHLEFFGIKDAGPKP